MEFISHTQEFAHRQLVPVLTEDGVKQRSRAGTIIVAVVPPGEPSDAEVAVRVLVGDDADIGFGTNAWLAALQPVLLGAKPIGALSVVPAADIAATVPAHLWDTYAADADLIMALREDRPGLSALELLAEAEGWEEVDVEDLGLDSGELPSWAEDAINWDEVNPHDIDPGVIVTSRGRIFWDI